MRRAITAAASVAVASLVAVAVSGAAGKKVHFTEHTVGNGIGGTKAVFAFHDSFFGNGAGTQVIKSTSTGGSDKEISYFGNGTTVSKGTFHIGVPDANGIAALTGSGHDVSGTGRAKGVKATYTYSGTFNTKTGVFSVTLKGTYEFP